MTQFSLGAFYCYGWVEISSYNQQAKVNRSCKIPGQKSLSGNPMLCSTICLAAGSKECALRIDRFPNYCLGAIRGKDLVAKGCYGPWRILLNVNPPRFPVCCSV